MADAQILLTTTGTLSPVVLTDMNKRQFVHPTTDFDLLTEFTYEQIFHSESLQAAITAGHITLRTSQSTLSYSIDNTKNESLFNANQIVGIPIDNSDIANQRVLVYNSTTGHLEYKNNSGRGVPTFSGSFFDSSTPYLQYSGSSYTTIMHFPYEGSGSITLTKMVVVASMSGSGSTGSVELFDFTNGLSVATASVTQEPVHIVNTTTFTNVPVGQSVFSLRYRVASGNKKIRIHSLMLY